MYPVSSLYNGKKKSLHTVGLFTITIRSDTSREIVRQRRWRRLVTEPAGVDKLVDYLWSDTKDVKNSTFLDSGHYMLSNGH